jgi:hypothetical protein
LSISPAIIGRVLKNDRGAPALKGKSLTKSAALLKHRIPIHTFYTPEERKLPGFIRIDTVRHCGQATSGQYILTLTATDVASGRICPYSLLNKAHCRTFDALRDVCADLPFPLREFHRKNDNCFVEQKNDAVVREYTGCDRFEGNVLQSRLAATWSRSPAFSCQQWGLKAR